MRFWSQLMIKPNMPDHNDELRNKGVEYEREDLTTKSIVAFLVGLALFAVIVHFALKGFFGFADRYYTTHENSAPMARTSPDPHLVMPADVEQFPQPRLETDERTEIFPFRESEEKHLDSYGVDAKTGAIHIPIDRAMQLVAERGLNTSPKTGEVPPAIVNMVKEAAARSDQSGGATGLEKTGVQVQTPPKQ
jgi:hypothetical protein